jgi:signal peptidase I
VQATRLRQLEGPPSGGPSSDSKRGWVRAGVVVEALGLVAFGAVLTTLLLALVGGWRLEFVRSHSMHPTVPKASLAAIAPVAPSDVQAGDVVVFTDPMDRTRRILHRVVDVVERGADGRFFQTKGDLNRTADPLLATSDDIQGRMRWHVPVLGRVAWALASPFGAVLLVLAPAMALVFGELRRLQRKAAGTA